MLKVLKSDANLSELRAQSLGVLVFEGKMDEALDALGDLKGPIKLQADIENFNGKKEKAFKVTLPGSRIPRVFLVGLGLESEVKLDDFRVAAIYQRGTKSCAEELYLFSKISAPLSQAIAEGCLRSYQFDLYKTKKEKGESGIKDVYIIGGDDEFIERGVHLACGQNYARGLANEPPNVINPLSLANIASELADDMKLDCKIYDEKGLEEMGMNALLAVGKGSVNPPRLIHLTYKQAADSRVKVALVGKGLTFDSGA